MLAAQIVAVIVFVIMFVMIVLDRIERQWVTLLCGLATLVVVFGILMHSGTAIMETLNFRTVGTGAFWYAPGSAEETSSGVNWATIIFIAGMMIMVEGMARAGFFRWLCMLLAKAVNYKPVPLLVTFMIMAAVLSMFIDSITVILFLAAVTVELSKLLRIDPVPMILSEIFCANLGGSSTMCGDPPNIIIGTSLGYTFSDFFKNTGLIALICLVVVVIYFYFVFRKKMVPDESEAVDYTSLPSPGSAIVNKRSFGISACIFAAAIVLLVTHARTGLTVAIIGVVIAAVTLITSGKNMIKVVTGIDYKTLLFFVGLFIVVGGLEQTGILELLANVIGRVSGGNLMVMVAIIIWVSAIASAFVDNIPFAATMIPIIRSLAAAQGVPLATLAWTLALGTDIGGSATPIGASANVVGTSVAAKNGHPISWGRYCKASAPAMVIVVAICMVMIFVRYC
ncbi:MAG: anion permease [Lachnospiraceae bacterium]|nr:anion permease [Lachnospiraceae bacterium]